MEKVIVIVGPTGVGKTKLSVDLARHFNTEIISADSMQIYKGMDIGTAKVTKDETSGIKHHLIDIKEIEESYSVFESQINIRKKITEINKMDKIPIIVGGTGLFIKAALYDYTFLKEEKRETQTYEGISNEELYEKLVSIDKESANKIHVNNRRRIIRALQIASSDIKKSDIIKSQKHKPLYDIKMIGLTTDRKTLYKRIDNRVDKMLEKGLLDEVKAIYDKYKGQNYQSLQGISYKELFLYFDKKITLEEAIDLIKKKSRNYAKRQYTWFNNQFRVNWFDVDFNNFDNTVKEVLSFLEHEDE
ncbi:TPA: tRNA (adenosine(37)-N6)-dimethylallyltransferase MiaA [bacterium]|nr:tRNA (adenosine(37)-N6)-dimethylallyltransferase MiaA [bacterium]